MHSKSVLLIALHTIDRLNNNPTEPSFICPTHHTVNEANMTGMGHIGICKDCLKPATQREIGKRQLSPLRIAGFVVAIGTYCVRISSLMRDWGCTNWTRMEVWISHFNLSQAMRSPSSSNKCGLFSGVMSSVR
jgi:hypothetical protein